VDTHVDPKKRQAHAVLLDNAMRRASEPVPITPEASSIRTLQLMPETSGAALLYWKTRATRPAFTCGAWKQTARSTARRAASRKSDAESYADYGRRRRPFLGVWEEDAARGRVDLMARHWTTSWSQRQSRTVGAGSERAAHASDHLDPDAVIAHGALQSCFRSTAASISTRSCSCACR